MHRGMVAKTMVLLVGDESGSDAEALPGGLGMSRTVEPSTAATTTVVPVGDDLLRVFVQPGSKPLTSVGRDARPAATYPTAASKSSTGNIVICR